jgi:flavin-dependent dehydrogenase
LQRFMENRHFKALGFQGARIPLYEGWIPIERRIGKGRVYLVGDAAAQVKVTTLGGVVTGFRGAVGLTEQVLKGGFSRELRALRRELDVHMLIRRSVHGFRQADYSRLVDSINNRMRQSLSHVNRDEAARLLWHICRDQPRLVWLGLRGLLARPPESKVSDLPADLSVCRPSVIQR